MFLYMLRSKNLNKQLYVNNMNLTYTSGIYQIKNLINQKRYVGSAVSLTSRKSVHFKSLRENRHYNIHLQRAWNKYGEEHFKFEILEVCSKRSLIEKEQYYLDKLNPEYNIHRIAGSPLGQKYTKKRTNNVSKAFKNKRQKLAKSVIQKYKSGQPMSNLAVEFKTSIWRIRKILKENRIKIRKVYKYHEIPVFQYNIGGKLIKKWTSCKNAASVLSYDISGICKCARGDIKTYKNYLWKY